MRAILTALILLACAGYIFATPEQIDVIKQSPVLMGSHVILIILCAIIAVYLRITNRI